MESIEKSVHNVCRLLSNGVSPQLHAASSSASSSSSLSSSFRCPKKARLDSNEGMAHVTTSPRMKLQTYSERFQTFSSFTYFAKPILLSPIICAARGWFNCGVDMLECSCCHAKLCIYFDPALTPLELKTVTRHYQLQLSTTGHANYACAYWDNTNTSAESSTKPKRNHPKSMPNNDDDSMIFIATKTPTGKTKTTTNTFLHSCVPSYLAKQINVNFIQLMEHSMPHLLVYNSVRTFLKTFLSTAPMDRWTISASSLSSSLHPNDELLLNQLRLQYQNDHDAANVNANNGTVPMECTLFLLLLAISGWTLTSNKGKGEEDDDDDNDNDDPNKTLTPQDTNTVSNTTMATTTTLQEEKLLPLECKLCGEQILYSFKNVDWIQSHKYYCPWRCGLPQLQHLESFQDENAATNMTEPCWKILLHRCISK